MTAPAIQEDDPVAAYLKSKQRPAGADPVAAYLATKRQTPTGHNGIPFVNAKPEGDPGIGTKTLGTIAALDRDIPGAEAAQAGIRALIWQQPYSQARADIRGAEDDAPAIATVPARMLGGGLSLALLPGGTAAKGAAYGALSGLGDSEEQSIESRGGQALAGAAIGGLAGAAGAKAATVGGRMLRPAIQAGGRIVGGIGGAFESLPQTVEGSLLPREVLQTGEQAAPLQRAIARPIARLPQSSEIADAVKPLSRQSHRTAASFQDFAQRLGGKPLPSSLDKQLNDLLVKARQMTPGETGSTYGDAEEAMGLAPHQQPDLEDLLRRSLALVKPSGS